MPSLFDQDAGGYNPLNAEHWRQQARLEYQRAEAWKSRARALQRLVDRLSVPDEACCNCLCHVVSDGAVPCPACNAGDGDTNPKSSKR